ncbi:Histone-lysine N-methyltransferase SETMAR [Acromyrmex echinatior]|uniref:Histone-lysine N-methyltransferase SETMAR n=1 Tax=Acromyrmex echinatior TaxID=103372 RepID=F4WBQ4_ACREC|nr:Histone-lysine N-methyltransferase SETMAR [Acromyrmex echinatior]
MEKNEFRAVIKHLHMKGLTPKKIKAELDNVHSISAPAFATVYNWVNKFKRGHTSTCDAPRSGRPIEATTPEIIDKVHDIVLIDRRVKVDELVEAIGISHGTVISILHEQLGMKKLSTRWVPRLLTVDQKRDPMAKFNEFRYELLPHPAYSPDLAPCDYFLFPNLKKWFKGKRFTREQLIVETEAYFEGLDKSYYSDGLKKLENRWIKCIKLKGDYVEK